MSGVSYGSVKRFESTGQISLLSLTKIAMALDIADELRNIFFTGTIQRHKGGHKWKQDNALQVYYDENLWGHWP